MQSHRQDMNILCLLQLFFFFFACAQMRTDCYPLIQFFSRMLIVMLMYHAGDVVGYRRGWGMATMQGLEGNNLENKT